MPSSDGASSHTGAASEIGDDGSIGGGLDSGESDPGTRRLRSLLSEADRRYRGRSDVSDTEEDDIDVHDAQEEGEEEGNAGRFIGPPPRRCSSSPPPKRQQRPQRRPSCRRGVEADDDENDCDGDDEDEAAMALAAAVKAVLVCPPGELARNSGVGSCSSSATRLGLSLDRTGDDRTEGSREGEEVDKDGVSAAEAVAAALAWGFTSPKLSRVEEEAWLGTDESEGDVGGVEAAVRAALAVGWSPQPSGQAANRRKKTRGSRVGRDGHRPPDRDRAAVDGGADGGVTAADVSTSIREEDMTTVSKVSRGGVDAGTGEWLEAREPDTLPPSPMVSSLASGSTRSVGKDHAALSAHSNPPKRCQCRAVRDRLLDDFCVQPDRHDEFTNGVSPALSRNHSEDGPRCSDCHGSRGLAVAAIERDTADADGLLRRGAIARRQAPPGGNSDLSALIGAASRIASLPPLEHARLAQMERLSDRSDGCSRRGSDERVEYNVDDLSTSVVPVAAAAEALVRVGADACNEGGNADDTTPYRFLRLAGVGRGWPPGVDPARREEWLSPVEFEAVFAMPFGAFRALPSWRQVILKQDVLLF